MGQGPIIMSKITLANFLITYKTKGALLPVLRQYFIL